MTTDADLDQAMRDKLLARLNLDAAQLRKEQADLAQVGRTKRGIATLRAAAKHLPTLAVIVTAAIGIMTYRDGIAERKRERFDALVTRLTSLNTLSEYEEFLSLSTLGAVRHEYADDPAYAFEIAYLAMPYVYLGKDREDLRLYAARVLAEAIGGIEDRDEFYRLNNTLTERTAQAIAEPENTTELFVRYTGLITCALTDAGFRVKIPSPGDRSKCDGWEKAGLIP